MVLYVEQNVIGEVCMCKYGIICWTNVMGMFVCVNMVLYVEQML